MRKLSNRKAFVRQLKLVADGLVMVRQVHGNVIHQVTEAKTGIVKDADGLFMQKKTKDRKTSSVGVVVGDCVPLLFADKNGRAIAAVHAGWKGTYGNIASEVVLRFTENGIKPADILVSVGPHICRDCYTVPEDRAQKFLHRHKDDTSIAFRKDNVWHLDIGYANIRQLENAGVLRDHIEILDKCTASDTREFFSYRKDNGPEYGEIIAVIGFSS